LFEPFEEADMKIYVGNMNFDTTESDLRTAFEAHGTVDSVSIITDRDTGRAKGFGFVEMSNDTEAQAAIDALNEKELHDRTLKVNKARPRNDNRGGGGRGGFGRDRY
jgi:RNA recognition motif-containing protein